MIVCAAVCHRLSYIVAGASWLGVCPCLGEWLRLSPPPSSRHRAHARASSRVATPHFPRVACPWACKRTSGRWRPITVPRGLVVARDTCTATLNIMHRHACAHARASSRVATPRFRRVACPWACKRSIGPLEGRHRPARDDVLSVEHHAPTCIVCPGARRRSFLDTYRDLI